MGRSSGFGPENLKIPFRRPTPDHDFIRFGNDSFSTLSNSLWLLTQPHPQCSQFSHRPDSIQSSPSRCRMATLLCTAMPRCLCRPMRLSLPRPLCLSTRFLPSNPCRAATTRWFPLHSTSTSSNSSSSSSIPSVRKVLDLKK